MPTLHWIGKEAVVKHHKDVPYRLLEPVAALSCIPSSPASPSPLAPLPQGGEGKTAPSPFKGEGWGEGKNAQIVDTDTSTTKNQNIENQNTENLIVQGDNLHALKALLPRYAGQVECIYIDPPYNTGNEGWVYNDNVNSAEIKRWLGEVVGKEGETLDRHDRWLCMMYPRLLLLKQFLRDDGAIFVSIDDYELHHLRILMDQIFGVGCYKNTIAVRRGIKNVQAQFEDVSALSQGHEYILVYSRNSNLRFPKLSLAHESTQPGKWDTFWRGTDRPTMRYELFGVKPDTGQWRWEQGRAKEAARNYEDYLQNHASNMSIDEWYLDNLTANNLKLNFVRKNDESSVQYYVPPSDGKLLSDNWMDILLSGSETSFDTEKNTPLIQRVIGWVTSDEDLILDSFAGSGTTAHAVLKQNAEDGGNRRFILVEMDENIAQNVTAERVKRVAQGYRKGKNALTPALSQGEREQSAGLLDNPRPLGEGAQSAGEGKDWVAGLGGGFQFCKLSAEPLFTALGQIRSDVTFAQLAEFVWFVETGTGFSPSPQPSPIKGEGAMLPSPRVGEGLGERGWTSPLLGAHQGRAIYLLYNGILKDKSVGGGNVLTQKVLDILPAHDGAKVIFAAANRLGAPKLAREQIVFKQTPYALNV